MNRQTKITKTNKSNYKMRKMVNFVWCIRSFPPVIKKALMHLLQHAFPLFFFFFLLQKLSLIFSQFPSNAFQKHCFDCPDPVCTSTQDIQTTEKAHIQGQKKNRDENDNNKRRHQQEVRRVSEVDGAERSCEVCVCMCVNRCIAVGLKAVRWGSWKVRPPVCSCRNYGNLVQ